MNRMFVRTCLKFWAEVRESPPKLVWADKPLPLWPNLQTNPRQEPNFGPTFASSTYYLTCAAENPKLVLQTNSKLRAWARATEAPTIVCGCWDLARRRGLWLTSSWLADVAARGENALNMLIWRAPSVPVVTSATRQVRPGVDLKSELILWRFVSVFGLKSNL